MCVSRHLKTREGIAVYLHPPRLSCLTNSQELLNLLSIDWVCFLVSCDVYLELRECLAALAGAVAEARRVPILGKIS